jgi:hypothetical protein
MVADWTQFVPAANTGHPQSPSLRSGTGSGGYRSRSLSGDRHVQRPFVLLSDPSVGSLEVSHPRPIVILETWAALLRGPAC